MRRDAEFRTGPRRTSNADTNEKKEMKHYLKNNLALLYVHIELVIQVDNIFFVSLLDPRSFNRIRELVSLKNIYRLAETF